MLLRRRETTWKRGGGELVINAYWRHVHAGGAINTVPSLGDLGDVHSDLALRSSETSTEGVLWSGLNNAMAEGKAFSTVPLVKYWHIGMMA